MENEEFSLSKQLEMLEATALHFVDKIIPRSPRVLNRMRVRLCRRNPCAI